MTTPVIIVGAGDLALEIYNWVKPSPDYEVVGFIDDNKITLNDEEIDLEIISSIKNFEPTNIKLLMGISDPETKLKTAAILKKKGAAFASFIHPTAIVSGGVKLGEGLIACPNSIISCNTNIGNFVTINLGTAVGHHVEVGDGTTFSSMINVSGHVKIGKGVFMGGNVVIIPKKKIGEYSKIAAGAVVFKNVKPKTTVAGNPAKKIL